MLSYILSSSPSSVANQQLMAVGRQPACSAWQRQGKTTDMLLLFADPQMKITKYLIPHKV